MITPMGDVHFHRLVLAYRRCAHLLISAAASGQGIYYEPEPGELEALLAYQDARAHVDSAIARDDARRVAGLRPSDPGVLDAILHERYMRHPALATRILEVLRARLGLDPDPPAPPHGGSDDPAL
jgi:hypothetical protein